MAAAPGSSPLGNRRWGGRRVSGGGPGRPWEPSRRCLTTHVGAVSDTGRCVSAALSFPAAGLSDIYSWTLCGRRGSVCGGSVLGPK